MRRPARTILSAIVGVGSALAGASPVVAQQDGRSWRPTVQVRSVAVYDDNPFLLTGGSKRRLDQVSPADQQSGRFRDMENANDLIPVSSIELGVSGPGLTGRDLSVSAGATYEANLWNARRRHAELEFTVEQALPHARRLRFRADWRPEYFSKNYLSGAADANADFEIGPDERSYARGSSNELDLSLGYRHRLIKATSRRPIALSAELQAGYFRRSYDAPFPGRDRRGPGASADLELALGRRWIVEVAYAFASEQADPTREVLILNENEFSRDFNGNGAVSEDSARAFELVDRSRAEHRVGLSVRSELSAAVSGEIAYERRMRVFGSGEQFDVAHRDRRDARNEVAVDVGVRLARGLRLSLGGRLAVQRTNRSGDPAATGEVTDYTRRVAYAGLRYRP